MRIRPYGFVIYFVNVKTTDNGHPERTFFQKFETFGLGQTNWAEILGGILAISSQTIGTILALNMSPLFIRKCSWIFFLQKMLVFRSKTNNSQNKILAVKNLEKSLCTSVFGDMSHKPTYVGHTYITYLGIYLLLFFLCRLWKKQNGKI